MERMIKEAKVKELLTGKKQFGKITIIDRKVDTEGREHPIMMSQQEFYNPDDRDDITIGIIYERWQVEP